jgi:hypothetical protein
MQPPVKISAVRASTLAADGFLAACHQHRAGHADYRDENNCSFHSNLKTGMTRQTTAAL